MSWLRVRAEFHSPPADFSPVIEVFRDHGVENTLEESAWIEGCIALLPGWEARSEALVSALQAAGADQVIQEPLAETDWSENWKQHFVAREIGSNLRVRPPWSAEIDDGRIDIEIDPGMAFGTGDHPTTRMCLELLDARIADGKLSGRRVADLGTGSGILAIAAAKAGADVWAVDVDAAAVEAAIENGARNGAKFRAVLGDGVRAYFQAEQARIQAGVREWEQDEQPLPNPPPIGPTPAAIHPEFDLIVANIISAALIRMAGDVYAALEPGGEWLVSGIIEANWPDVLAAAEAQGFRCTQRLTEADWTAAAFRR